MGGKRKEEEIGQRRGLNRNAKGVKVLADEATVLEEREGARFGKELRRKGAEVRKVEKQPKSKPD